MLSKALCEYLTVWINGNDQETAKSTQKFYTSQARFHIKEQAALFKFCLGFHPSFTDLLRIMKSLNFLDSWNILDTVWSKLYL